MNFVGSRFYVVAFFAIFFIAGCACPKRISGHFDGDFTPSQRADFYHGRMALKFGNDAPPSPSQIPPQSFSAAFELVGNAQTGTLEFYSPLGSTIAALSWTPVTAQMRSNGEIRSFDSLENLLKSATGASLPVASLFAWLAGENVAVDGWEVDLSQFPSGRLTSRRSYPLPTLELRLVLDQ